MQRHVACILLGAAAALQPPAVRRSARAAPRRQAALDTAAPDEAELCVTIDVRRPRRVVDATIPSPFAFDEHAAFVDADDFVLASATGGGPRGNQTSRSVCVPEHLLSDFGQTRRLMFAQAAATA